jgi:hypothetical protein
VRFTTVFKRAGLSTGIAAPPILDIELDLLLMWIAERNLGALVDMREKERG